MPLSFAVWYYLWFLTEINLNPCLSMSVMVLPTHLFQLFLSKLREFSSLPQLLRDLFTVDLGFTLKAFSTSLLVIICFLFSSLVIANCIDWLLKMNVQSHGNLHMFMLILFLVKYCSKLLRFFKELLNLDLWEILACKFFLLMCLPDFLI